MKSYQPLFFGVAEFLFHKPQTFNTQTVIIFFLNKSDSVFGQPYTIALALHDIAGLAFEYKITAGTMFLFMLAHSRYQISREGERKEIKYKAFPA